MLVMFKSQGIRGEDLKVLFDKVPDISLLHEVPFHVAFNKFFGDVCEQYDSKLGLESAIESQKSELDRVSKERQEEEKEVSDASQMAFNILFGKPFDLNLFWRR